MIIKTAWSLETECMVLLRYHYKYFKYTLPTKRHNELRPIILNDLCVNHINHI